MQKTATQSLLPFMAVPVIASAVLLGVVILPLMIFHHLQLFVCAWLAARYARMAECDARGGTL